MLIKGSYHPSAPVHLVLSHCSQDPSSRALLLSPSRNALKDALIEFNDDWINCHGGEGRTCGCASRVNMLYPPKPAHLTLLLSMLHEYDGTVHHAKTTLDIAPTLVVLHELSSYFSQETSEHTVASYMSLICHAMALVSSWSAQSATSSALAVFDSGLDQLKLPVFRPFSPGDPGEDEVTAKREPVALFVEQYFEWIGTAEELEAAAPSTSFDTSSLSDIEPRRMKTMRLRLLRRARRSRDEIIWNWSETFVGAGLARTVFLW
ncbi:hypothetical protein A0H81_04029 [Grifola frondosa]|uniref:Uncharacterized protein n=1 Tax=Grifola frondosa TaxID=5627 RepID=A0A1C7MIA1_GRIFR|nr:hypothetical protein A0H81_04029 [Grifola frondosa]